MMLPSALQDMRVQTIKIIRASEIVDEIGATPTCRDCLWILMIVNLATVGSERNLRDAQLTFDLSFSFKMCVHKSGKPLLILPRLCSTPSRSHSLLSLYYRNRTSLISNHSHSQSHFQSHSHSFSSLIFQTGNETKNEPRNETGVCVPHFSHAKSFTFPHYNNVMYMLVCTLHLYQ